MRLGSTVTPDRRQSAVSDRPPSPNAGVPAVLLVALLVLLAAVAWLRDKWTDALPFAALVLIALFVLFIRRTPMGAWFDKVKTSVWMLPLGGFAVTVFVVGEEAGSKEFHSAAAQVIPVLALGLAIEARAFAEQMGGDDTTRATALVTLCLLAYGEYEALDSLATTLGQDAELVWAALAAGALGVLLVASLGSRAASVSAREQKDQRRQEPSG